LLHASLKKKKNGLFHHYYISWEKVTWYSRVVIYFLFFLPWIPCVLFLLASISYGRALAHSRKREEENAMWWLGAVDSPYHGHDWPFSCGVWGIFLRKSSAWIVIESSGRREFRSID
jgi:hypothetical protein